MIRTAIVPTVLAATALATSPAIAAEIQVQATGPVIELVVNEQVEVEPDTVTISAGVTNQAQTAQEALSQNSAQMQSVIERLRSLGIPERDIQTTRINLGARFDYDQQTQQQVFRGYQASNQVSVKLRDTEEVGAVLDALVKAGANDINGPSFSVSDDTGPKAEARKRALDILFQSDVREDDLPAMLAVEARRAANEPARESSWLYARDIVDGIIDNRDEIDEQITTHARDWSLARMPAVDRALLRIGVWEILYNDEVPTAVAIDEAVELAKEYSTDDSGSFVHGILARVARSS